MKKKESDFLKRMRLRAYAMVKAAKKKGTLIPESCSACGAKAEAHHNDYSKPLEVVWLCRKHHRLVDSTTVDEKGVHEHGRQKMVGRKAVYTPKTKGGKRLVL
jgi:hypothetical protein